MITENVNRLQWLIDTLNDGKSINSGSLILCSQFDAEKINVELYYGQYKKEPIIAQQHNPVLTQPETWSLIPETRKPVFIGTVDKALTMLNEMDQKLSPSLYRKITTAGAVKVNGEWFKQISADIEKGIIGITTELIDGQLTRVFYHFELNELKDAKQTKDTWHINTRYHYQAFGTDASGSAYIECFDIQPTQA
jgi:hypothetical protein